MIYLCDELLFFIISFLDISDNLYLSASNKRFNKICQNDKIWEIYYYNYFINLNSNINKRINTNWKHIFYKRNNISNIVNNILCKFSNYEINIKQYDIQNSISKEEIELNTINKFESFYNITGKSNTHIMNWNFSNYILFRNIQIFPQDQIKNLPIYYKLFNKTKPVPYYDNKQLYIYINQKGIKLRDTYFIMSCIYDETLDLLHILLYDPQIVKELWYAQPIENCLL
jgi:hypothetical protein